jgi:hypothetical protein
VSPARAAALDVASPENVLEAASRLVEEPLLEATRLRGGGNNQVFRLRTATRDLALKLYGWPARADRDGLRREFDGLRFLRECGVTTVPRAVAFDDVARIALYEWIDGTPLREHGPGDVDAALRMLAALHDARLRPGARRLPPAVEEFRTFEALVAQMRARIERLIAVGDAELSDYLNADLIPALAQRAALVCGKFDAVPPAGARERTLSPSDFSFHNALRSASGELCFLDFEFFGWDDPAKLCSDFLRHPATALSPGERCRFLAGALGLYGADDPRFEARLRAAEPMFTLKWALIVLNEFLPEVWRRRIRSGEQREREAALAEQLTKSRALLAASRSLF